MVPKLHAKGSSFKGAAVYLLHDKDQAETSDRVQWVELRNLAVEDPHAAWKIMVATAMDQQRLKAAAGIRNTGRKSDKYVLHFTLSWHPEQQPSKSEMIDAAEGALKAIGADDRQTMMVCHNDEDHAHVHLLVNRVSAEDGRMLPSSKEKLNLSRWAQSYEEQTGIYCENRVLNNALRDNGQYVRGEKNVSRHIFEAQRDAVANDNQQAEGVIDAQRAKDHALSLRGRNMSKLHAAAWDKLESAHRQRQESLASKLRRDVAKAEAAIIEEMRPEWLALLARQNAERRTFDALEETLFGKTSNMVKTIRLSSRLLKEDRTGIIKRTFGILTNAGQRKSYFEASQQRDRSALNAKQSNRIAEAKAKHRAAKDAKLAEYRTIFARDRTELSDKQEADRKRLSGEWKARNTERQAALKAATRQKSEPVTARKDFKATAADNLDSEYLDLYRQTSFDQVAKPKTAEQDNEKNPDQDIADDD